MIRAIRRAQLHITNRDEIAAVIAGYRVHDGGGNDDHQK